MNHISEEYKKAHGLTPETIADTVIAFYQKVDEACLNLIKALNQNGIQLNCKKGCSQCCQDNLTMTKAEAEVIHKLFPDIGNQSPHPVGKCPFLGNDNACRIYPARPYICRTHGLPLKWLEDSDASDDNQEVFEQRDICELNEKALDLLTLPSDLCWNSDTAETQLAIMNLCTFDNHDRIPMRQLFNPNTK